MTRSLRILAAILFAGAALQALLWSRQWVYGDQYALLTPALELLDTGHLPPYAKTMSGGGRIPGSLLPLLISLPLRIWADYRAPAVLIGLFHAMAGGALSICLWRALGARFAVAYLSVYWLSPWRLYHSGFLWEPAYLFLPAALHLVCAWHLRPAVHGDPARGAGRGVRDGLPGARFATARLGWSMLLTATLVLAMQLHGSFVVLALLTALLAMRRLIRLDVIGGLLGAAVGGLTLIPTLQAGFAGTLPRMVPGETEDFSRVLVGLLNTLKSLAYWFRLGSLDIGRRLRQTVFGAADGADASLQTVLASGAVTVVIALSIVSMLLAVFASWRYFRRQRLLDGPDAPDMSDAPDTSGLPDRPHPDDSPGRRSSERWIRAYAGWCLAALCAAATVSPVPVQGWHVVIAFHAACLPVAAWLRAAFWGASSLPRIIAVSFVILEIAAVLLLAFGHPMYQPVSGDALLGQDIPDIIRPLIPARP